MEKKSILMILIIIILVVVIGAFAYNQFSGQNTQLKVGSSTFNLPDGFYEVNSSMPDVVNISNGYDTFLLKECGNDDATKYAKKYVKDVKDNNQSAIIKNFTVDDVVVYKSSIVNNTHNFHYWFNHNGKAYTIGTYQGSNNMDNIVKDLIKKSK